ncbi:MAG: hypothetical protein K5764_03670, partial [Prevotella sp.]|nr:hypothetical protein [Prevotella sp.]
KAFHNEGDGQMYANNDSYSGEFKVTWNYIYTGTLLALNKKVNERNFGSGLATRLTVIPMPSTHYQMIPFEESGIEADEKRIDTMREWAFKLDATKGELTFAPLVKKLYEWTARRMADASEDESQAEEMLLKRCAYHGINFAAPFIMMRHWDELHQEGPYWCGEIHTDDTDWQLVQTIVDLQFASQMHFFGAMAENYFDNINGNQTANKAHYRKTIEGFNQLPELFGVEEVKYCFGLKNEKSVRVKIARLVDDKIVELIQSGEDKGKYKKLVKSLA